jgi:3D (Asp-Asp-Asp) domain-containing protein
MIGLIMKTLNSIPIVSVKNIVDLKHYLVNNYPDLDAVTTQQYVAEFISKTIDSCLTYFSVEYRQPLRKLVLDNARKVNVFEVYASDILKAGLQLGNEDRVFQREIANWAGEFPVDNLTKETVVGYIMNHCRGKESMGPVSGRVLPVQPQIRPARGFEADPHAPTVALRLNNDQTEPVREETAQLISKWYNPYLGEDDDESEEREISAGNGTMGRGIVGILAAKLQRFQKMLVKKFHSLTKNRNLCIAAVIFLFLLIGFPRAINSKPDNKAIPLIAAKLARYSDGFRSRLSHESSQVVNAPVATGIDQVRGGARLAKRTIEDQELSRKVDPILDTQNTIIIGYVKEKTASGLVEVPVRRYFERKMRLNATAYDLSLASCGKGLDHPEYGITRTGTRAKRGRTIAVDPRVIPLGRKVYIVFPKKYRHMDGIYIAEDTGRKIKGYRIDVFWGEDRVGEKRISREARRFGRRKVELYLLQS